jgi:glycosyltransferase 2 family protein
MAATHDESTTPGPWRRRLRLAGQLVLTVLVTWLIVAQVGVTMEDALSLDVAIPAPRPLLLGLSVLLLVFCFGLAARFWGLMVAELGEPDPGWLSSIRIVMTANLGRYIPGKVWQVAGLALLSRRQGIPATVGTAAALLGQLFHLAGAMVVGTAVLAGPGPGVWGGRVALVLFLLFVVLASIPPVLQKALALGYRFAGLDPSSAPRPGVLFGPRWVLLHTLVWIGYGLAFSLLVMGLGLEGAVPSLIATFSAAYLIGYLAIFAPAGIGVREGVLIALLQPALGGAAVGVAILARVWMTVVELLPAGGFALWEIFRSRRHGQA